MKVNTSVSYVMTPVVTFFLPQMLVLMGLTGLGNYLQQIMAIFCGLMMFACFILPPKMMAVIARYSVCDMGLFRNPATYATCALILVGIAGLCGADAEMGKWLMIMTLINVFGCIYMQIVSQTIPEIVTLENYLPCMTEAIRQDQDHWLFRVLKCTYRIPTAG